MYTIEGYGDMIRDAVRIRAYEGALGAIVRPESVVLDIGTGMGILALMACRSGARKVYAMEPSNVIQLARQAAEANGFADRIEFIQGTSTRVDLREKVDVIVSDIRGVLPLSGISLPSMIDARARFLVPGGHLIPQEDTLWVALVTAPDPYRQRVETWDCDSYGFDFHAIRDRAVNCWRRFRFSCDQLSSEPSCWARINYRTLSEPNVAGKILWTVDRITTVHGLAIWFDTEVTDGITFSNSPASPTKQIYGQGFFPWPQPMQLSPGDLVSVKVRADLVGLDYVWGWNADITKTAEPTRRIVSFRQSTFFGGMISPHGRRKRTHTFLPKLNEDGHIDCLVLQQMAEGLPLGQIARNVVAKFPQYFPEWQAAMNHVGMLSEKYSV